MASQSQPSRTEIRITVSVGPEDNILGHGEVAIIHHAENASALTLQDAIEEAMHRAMGILKAGDAR
jgi:hypothetical protein